MEYPLQGRCDTGELFNAGPDKGIGSGHVLLMAIRNDQIDGAALIVPQNSSHNYREEDIAPNRSSYHILRLASGFQLWRERKPESATLSGAVRARSRTTSRISIRMRIMGSGIAILKPNHRVSKGQFPGRLLRICPNIPIGGEESAFLRAKVGRSTQG